MSALLVRGGCLYPADAGASVISDAAVLIAGSRIVATGPRAEVEALLAGPDPYSTYADLTVLDARGQLILPGFVNPHWHDLFAMRLPFRAALRTATDRDDVPAFMALGGDIPQISAMFDSFTDRIDALAPEEALAIARYSLWTQLRTGVTTLGDVGSFNRPEALMQAARDLGMRCSVSTWASDSVCVPGEAPRRTRDTDAVLTRIEDVLTAATQDTTGLVRARPTSVYVTNMSDELCAGFAELAARHDVPFATHVAALRNEAAAMRSCYGASGVHHLAEHGLVNDRLMAVHCAFGDEDENDLLVAARAHISHSPAKYGHAGESSLTETRVIPQLRRRGLDVSLSTDGAALPVGGMVEAMRVTYQTYNELAADPTEVLPTDALAMATSIAARGLEWDEVGSLEPGKQADLVLVPADDWRYLLNPRPLEGFLTIGSSADVHTVIVAGRPVVVAGQPATADAHRLEADYLDALESFSVRVLGIDRDLAAAVVGARRAVSA